MEAYDSAAVRAQGILYGDKVINVINQRWRDVYPKPDGEAYTANGTLSIVVGQYKTKKFKGLPWKLAIRYADQNSGRPWRWSGCKPHCPDH